MPPAGKANGASRRGLADRPRRGNRPSREIGAAARFDQHLEAHQQAERVLASFVVDNGFIDDQRRLRREVRLEHLRSGNDGCLVWRCRFPAPIDASELQGDGGGDPSLLVVVVPPESWIGDPGDPDGCLVCGDCATISEIAEWMVGLALIEQGMDGDDA